jgi:hypothetical protein
MAAEGDNIVRFTYTGADDEWIDEEATHITIAEDCTVVRARAFRRHRNIVEVICHEDVEEIEQYAFFCCRSLRRVIMPGVKIVEQEAFYACEALEHVVCDNLEMIGCGAFGWCTSLRSINLPSVRIVQDVAFIGCKALTDVKFGSKLERIEESAFYNCPSLQRITIPLKDGLITADDTFKGCTNLHQVDLIVGEIHKTIAALHLEKGRNDMNEEIDSINQILLNASSGGRRCDGPGEKARAIRRWIRSVLRKIIHYQTEHRHLLNEAATILELALPNDIVMKKVLPFLNLPLLIFEVGDDDDDDDDEDSDDDTQSSESSVGDEEEE